MPANIKYIAEIKNTREVTLLGNADPNYWKDRLKGEELFPYCSSGRAELALSAVRSKWMGVKFNELSISVVVSRREDGSSRDGFFLVSAFNSSRIFAWVERVWFQTPYRRGCLEVQAQDPASFKLIDDNQIVLQATRSNRAPCRRSEEVWEGPIFLPKKASAKGQDGNVFFAKLSGLTEVTPFSTAQDTMQLNPSTNDAGLRGLADSHFTPTEWRVRLQAAHARSKTYRRIRDLASG